MRSAVFPHTIVGLIGLALNMESNAFTAAV